MKQVYFLVLFSLPCIWHLQVKAQTLNRRFATSNGGVFATLQSNDTVYIGGNFSQVGMGVKNLARYNGIDSVPDLTFPQLEGTIYAIEKDGSGGYYISGYFLKNFNGTSLLDPVNGYPAAIHILPNFILDPAFKVYTIDYANQYVQALKKKGDRLYMAGRFTNINGVGRKNVAALDPLTGSVLQWQPDAPDNSVDDIEATDSLVFIRGVFSHVANNFTSSGFAALKTTDGLYEKAFPNAVDGQVTTISLDNSSLYFGGTFSKTGVPSQGLAQISTTDSKQNYKFPFTDGIVYTIVADGSGGFYAGGTFSHIGTEYRPYLAHILANGKVDASFDAKPDGYVNTITTEGTNIYFGGSFTRVNDINRNYAAAVNKTTGALTTWDPDLNNTVLTMACAGGKVFMSGYFTSVKGSNRHYAAAVTTGNSLSPWDPNPDNIINSFAINNSATSIFLAGNFTTLKGIPRQYLAKVNTSTGALSSWNPSPNNVVNCIALAGNKIYAGGYFNTINGINKQYFAAIDTGSNNPAPLQADANNIIRTVSVISNKVLVGGEFTSIQDSARSYLARVDLTTGKTDNWNPAPDGSIYCLLATTSIATAGGNFSSFGAIPRNHIAAIDVNTYRVKNFNPQPSLNSVSSVNKIFRWGTEVFAGGALTYSDSAFNYYYNIVAFDSNTANISRRFIQSPNSTIDGLAVLGNKLYVGGNFTQVYNSIGGTYTDKYYLASYDLGTNKLTNDAYNPNGRIYELISDGNNVIAGGNFSLTNFVNRNNLAAIKISTGFPMSWDPNVNGQVSSLAIKDSSLFAGGYFTGVGAASRPYLAAISTKSGFATNWYADADAFVKKLVIKDTVLYVAGSFNTIKGTSRHYAAAVSTTGKGVLSPWDPNPDNSVEAILPLNNNVYLAGYFSTIKGSARQYLAMVNNKEGSPSSWNPSPNYNVLTLAISGNTLYAGGIFTTIAGQSRTSLAAFNTTANTLTSFNAKLKTTTASIPNVISTASFGKNLFIAGIYLDSVNGSSRINLAAVDTGTKKASSFNPKPDGQVNTLLVGKNKLFAGGNWSYLGNKVSPSYFAVYTLEPLRQDSLLTFSNLATTSVKAGVTKGSGEGRIFIVKDGAAPAAPADGKKYTANKKFKSGNITGTGSYVVYAGTADTVTVTNLVSNHTYYFNVYEYNGSGAATEYLQSGALSGSITIPCPVFAPVITASGSTSGVCPGKTITLTSSPAGKYLWSTGDTTKNLVVTTAGTYSVSVIDSNGCNGSSAVISVSYTGCVAPASLSATNITGTSATLNWGKISCAVRYELQYRLADSVAWTTVQPAANGTSFNLAGLGASRTYQWRVRTACMDLPVVVSGYSSIAGFTTTGSLLSNSVAGAKTFPGGKHNTFTAMLYPNPAREQSILQVTGAKSSITVLLTDLAGKIIWKRNKIIAGNINIPVEDLNAGTYLVVIKDENHAETIKLVKRN